MKYSWGQKPEKASGTEVVVNLVVRTPKELSIIHVTLFVQESGTSKLPFSGWQWNVRLMTDELCVFLRTLAPSWDLMSVNVLLWDPLSRLVSSSHNGTTPSAWLHPKRKNTYFFMKNLFWKFCVLTEMQTERQVHGPVTSFAFSPPMTLEGF